MHWNQCANADPISSRGQEEIVSIFSCSAKRDGDLVVETNGSIHLRWIDVSQFISGRDDVPTRDIMHRGKSIVHEDER